MASSIIMKSKIYVIKERSDRQRDEAKCGANAKIHDVDRRELKKNHSLERRFATFPYAKLNFNIEIYIKFSQCPGIYHRD